MPRRGNRARSFFGSREPLLTAATADQWEYRVHALIYSIALSRFVCALNVNNEAPAKIERRARKILFGEFHISFFARAGCFGGNISSRTIDSACHWSGAESAARHMLPVLIASSLSVPQRSSSIRLKINYLRTHTHAQTRPPHPDAKVYSLRCKFNYCEKSFST